LHTLWLYHRGILSGRRRFRACFWRTPYIHGATRQLIRNQYGKFEWDFTFQIQSLFDGSIPGTPHFVYTDHTHLANLEYPTFNKKDLYHPSWIVCEREIYAHSDLTFVWSTNMVRTLVAAYNIDSDQVRCVFAGANANVPEASEIVLKEHKARNVLFVGLDWERKGGPDLLAAFSVIRAQYSDAQAVIVSAYSPPRETWPPGVTFTGKVSLAAIATHFENADIFCMPTYLEPFGIVFIEAMAYGLPIVSTRIGALPDLVEDGVNGFLVDPGNVQGLSEHLTRLLEDERVFTNMAREARSRYDRIFNWSAIFTNIRAQVYAAVQARSPEK
jgi:glycosyltransferase involved in cell wall biosynthesis